MRSRTVLFASSLFVALTVAGCQEQATDPGAAVPVGRQASTLDGAGINRSALTLPGNGRVRDLKTANLFGAINADDYVCTGSTPLSDWWLDAALAVLAAERELFLLLYVDLAADMIPTYEALFFQTSATPQTFGYNGEYTDVMLKADKDTKRFWDIPSANIQLVAMHGTMLLDTARVAATYRYAYGVPAADAAVYAAMVREAMLASEGFNGGNHPFFTFNAYAMSFGGLPEKIVMGDGVLAGYEALGFADVAPQALYAHEFGHHIQFENNYFGEVGETVPEQTRYTEMMADAFAAYYLTHKRGAAMNQKRVAQFLEVFYQSGDCAFTDDGHHGTPNQRMKATQFGFAVAAAAQKQGHILTSAQFHDLFVAAYPAMIAPDAN